MGREKREGEFMTFKWENYHSKILAMEAQKYSQTEIAAKISEMTGEDVSRDMVRHALVRARENSKKLTEMPTPDRIPYVTKYMDYLTGEKRPEPKETYKRANLLSKKKAKVLELADLHIPFHNEEIISQAIECHRDADGVVIVADFIDAYDCSFFNKNLDLPFVFEMDEALRILEYLSETFDWIEALEANHEDRVKRTIESNLPPALQFLARTHILEVLASPFSNIYVHTGMWFFQQGSVIYSHPSKASRVELKVPMDVEAHFTEWGDHYGLDPWNTILCAHTHTVNVGYTAHRKVMETGSLCNHMGYAYSPKIPYKRPSRLGYVVVTLEEGTCVWNETREYTFPLEPMRK